MATTNFKGQPVKLIGEFIQALIPQHYYKIFF